MFTGIITDVGRIAEIVHRGDPRLVVETQYDPADIALGASIGHSGVCLSVIETAPPGHTPRWYAVQMSAETLAVTTAKDWTVGTRLNLERALRLGDELGGHIVSGHVDGVGTVIETRAENESLRLTIEAPAELARSIARKGSIAVDGISLTVNEVDGPRFGVNIIPHTQVATTLGAATSGTKVNLEIDMLARYVARLLSGGEPA